MIRNIPAAIDIKISLRHNEEFINHLERIDRVSRYYGSSRI